MKYVNKQTNNMYINKHRIVKARFNPNSIKNLIKVKISLIFHLQMSIQICNLSKQGKNLYKQTNNNYGWI